ncbi:TPA: DUF2591 family protein [Klebsiella pneumoniae subsp. pneumoniae]|nr:DUF2591 family protein [Klebsiella pneumoniae subsp. pneumoniae]HBQ5925269.1 DUF2591 family protein [Klebsiella pneumoniae subsp. pneumoniae]HBQ5965824.1 DUF2591 family protein [Klebsiella pneumoniae subsp. pneumoniae]
MDYSKLSDFEINKLVFERKTALAALSYPHSADKRSCGHKDINNIYHWFDFCNKPADAWPIISSHHISIIYVEALSKWCAGNPYWVDGCEWQLDIDVVDENPLRAAMIVFLMMQESK